MGDAQPKPSPPRRRLGVAALLLAVLVALTGCIGSPITDPAKTLRIVAGSEQRAVLERVVTPWCQRSGYHCTFELKGSVDQARLLQSGNTDYDAYWFASSVFAQLGNNAGQLSDLQPMFLTPIVYAGWKSDMQRLGFVDNPDVGIEEIIKAVEGGQTKVWTTNPTQSNSGATVLFSFLNHFAGNGPGQPLTEAQLDSPQVAQGISAFVKAMERTPPSTGTMMDQCVEAGDACETLFTYEDLVIEYNQRLVAEGHEPLYVVYPTGSLAISDAPLGFRGTDPAKKQIFTELQQYLLTDAGARDELQAMGRRPADSIGLTLDNPDRAVFNPDWGIKTDIREQGIAYPSTAVIQKALDNYHLKYRRPVAIQYCLDGSGSMNGDGWDGVKKAAHEVFDPERARVNLLQTGPEDVTTVTVFNSRVAAGPWRVDGNNPDQLRNLERQVTGYRPGGGTNMYTCLSAATRALASEKDRKKLIVLMTDGQSDTSGADPAVRAATAAGIPVVAIAFGDADPEQMEDVAQRTGGAYVASDDLISALRTAAGYK